MPKPLIFDAFVMNTPSHLSPGLWTHPADEGFRYNRIDHRVGLARLLEEGGFSAMFIADSWGAYDAFGGSMAPAFHHGLHAPINDPLLLVPAMAAATKHLAFGVTCSVSYEHPFALARRFSTLDHLTDGRIGWNIVTSALDTAARNFGRPQQLAHDDRYDRAEEFLDVCYKLWEGSWAVSKQNSRAVPAVLASAHEQSVPIFQQLARGHPSGRDDVRAIPAVAAQRRGFVGGARDRHQP